MSRTGNDSSFAAGVLFVINEINDAIAGGGNTHDIETIVEDLHERVMGVLRASL